MKENIKEQQELKEQKELSNDELLNVTGGEKDVCLDKTETECKKLSECTWKSNKYGYLVCTYK